MPIKPPSMFDWFKKRIVLYSFFSKSNSRILYCKKFPTAELIPYIIDFQNPFKQLNNYIEYAKSLDLEYIDEKLAQGGQLAHDTKWIDNWKEVRQVLKLGYLIKDISQKTQHTPIQLILGSEPNKYAVHPGSVRITAMLGALELQTCDLIYCWDKELDSYPFVLDYEFEEITKTEDFLSLFNDNSMVYREVLSNDQTQELKNQEAIRLQKKLLHDRNLDCYSYDFLTTFDTWEKKVETRVKFSEVFHFHSDTECSIAGINFIKQGMWTRA